MANAITVTVACTITGVANTPPGVFAVNDVVQPSNPYYNILLQDNYAVDSANPASTAPPTVMDTVRYQRLLTEPVNGQSIRFNSRTGVFEPYVPKFDIAKMVADNRSKLPLAPSAFTVAQSGTNPDATLTKFFGFDSTGIANTVNRLATVAEMAAYPCDFGVPDATHLIYSGGSTLGYKWATCFQAAGLPSASVATIASPNVMTASYRFLTNSPKFLTLFYKIISTSGYKIEIDGQPVSLRPSVGIAGVFDYILITLDGAWHEITIKTSALFYGCWLNPIYDVVKPEPEIGLTMFTAGDSFTAASVYADNGAAAGGIIEEGYGQLMEELIGGGSHYIDAIAATGFIPRANSTYQSPNNNYQDRVIPQINRLNKLDIFSVPNGPANDVGNGLSNASIVIAVTAVYQAVRTKFPLAKLVLGNGITPPYSNWIGKGPTYTALLALLIPAMSSIGVYYVDLSGWITGTGHASNGAVTNVANCGTTAGSAVVTGAGFAASFVGSPVTGTGIPAGAYMASWQSGAQFTLSVAATATTNPVTLSFGTPRRDGNADWMIGNDSVHGTAIGYLSLKKRYAEKLRKIIADDGTLLNTVV